MDEQNRLPAQPQTIHLEDLLARDGRLVYRVSGSSMMPLIRRGRDLVDIRTQQAIRPYDIALYRRHVRTPDGETIKYVLHRILKDCGDHFLILGDNCIATEQIPKEDVLGIVVAILRDGKKNDSNSIAQKLYRQFWVKPWRLRIAFRKWTRRLPLPINRALKKLALRHF